MIFIIGLKDPNNIIYIVAGFFQGCLSQNKPISDLQNFLIQASQDQEIGIDIVYNTIYSCCLNKKVQIGSENFKQLIQIINNDNNKKKGESQKILCGMYVSDYFFKKHQSQRDKTIMAPTDIPQEFINLLNEVLGREKSNKITKIEDLTIKEIKTLFNDLMSIKFNQTKNGVDGNLLNIGPFLEIITSLAEHSGIDENTKIGDLYDWLYNNKKKQKEIQKKLEKEEELTKIETFQNKLNNFCYAKIKAGTKIDNLKDFITKVLKLKKEDFGKKGFKTFNVGFPKHAVTLVIDTSKSLNQFLKDNKKEIKDMVMFDSSHGIENMINIGLLKFSNQTLADIINKIPVQKQIYQENGTCWGNAVCTNSSLLNKYEDYNQIVDVNSITQNLDDTATFKPQEGVQESIINETSSSFGKLTDKIKEEKDYEEVQDEAGNIIKFNVKQNQLFQQPLEVFKAKQKTINNLADKLLGIMKEKKIKKPKWYSLKKTKNKYEQKVKKLKEIEVELENLKQQEQFIKETKGKKDIEPIIEKYDTLEITEKLEKKVKEELDKLQPSKKVGLEL